MKTVSVHEAKTHLSKLLRRVLSGEEVVITTSGRPIAKLVAIETVRARRAAGLDAGKGRISVDFNAPLPQAIQKYFDGKE